MKKVFLFIAILFSLINITKAESKTKLIRIPKSVTITVASIDSNQVLTMVFPKLKEISDKDLENLSNLFSCEYKLVNDKKIEIGQTKVVRGTGLKPDGAAFLALQFDMTPLAAVSVNEQFKFFQEATENLKWKTNKTRFKVVSGGFIAPGIYWIVLQKKVTLNTSKYGNRTILESSVVFFIF